MFRVSIALQDAVFRVHRVSIQIPTTVTTITTTTVIIAGIKITVSGTIYTDITEADTNINHVFMEILSRDFKNVNTFNKLEHAIKLHCHKSMMDEKKFEKKKM